ncbi:MAG: GH116 family glycosyl hydrolase, partial [Melioribacteraceae bacterium]
MLVRLLVFFLFLPMLLPAQIKIGLINLNQSKVTDPEIQAAYEFLKTNKSFKPEIIGSDQILNMLSKKQGNNSGFSVIWLHRPDTTELRKEETDPALIHAVKNYVRNGGALLLTLDAVKYLNALGLESEVPSVRYADAVDDGYGRKLGMHSFRYHPIFNGLNGGAYIFNPAHDIKTRQIGFFGESVPQNGKVAAVDWAYINMKEDSRLVVEYEYGKGKVLAVGAYTVFNIKNNNRAHLELFANNCLNYLAGKLKGEKKYYWNYKKPLVLPGEIKIEKSKAVKLSAARGWNKNGSQLKISNQHPGENFWNTAGERILIMGKERGGIDEIWTHPLMALRDYEVGISGGDTVSWLKNYSVSVEVRPESFIRKYEFHGSTLTEIITASPEKPAAVIHYELKGTTRVKLVVKFKSNLRFMWPYSEKTTGSIYYGWNDRLNAFLINDESRDFVTIVGSTQKPAEKKIGHFENIDSRLNGTDTDKTIAAAYAHFNLKPDDNLDIVISASSEGIQKTVDEYRSAASDPEKIYRSAALYSEKFLNSALMVTTPDKDFNEGYKWALIGSDRFFVNTPGIGKSLVAGYSTTAKGWDGGQKVNGRPGYAWYFGRDGVWSGFALLGYGDFEKVKSILELMGRYQDLNGKIFHELTTSGAVHYDASDATPLYIILAGRYLRNTGDLKFIRQNWPHIKKAIDFCYSTDTDMDRLIENTNVGHGWVEGGGLYTAHTEVYLAACWSEALSDAAEIALAMGLNDESRKYSGEAAAVKKIIDDEFWNDETGFLNFSKMKDGKFNPEKTVLAAVPVYFNMVEYDKAEKITSALA